MKKCSTFAIILLIVVALSSLVSSATRVTTGDSKIDIPSNVFGFDLHTRNTATSVDTFADTSVNKIYGPYAVCRDGGPMAKYIGVKADAITGTTPQMQLQYQFISGTSITDTIAAWTYGCEINASAKDTVIDVSAKVGKSIVFRIDNTDSTACRIHGLLHIELKDSKTEFVKIK